MYNFVPNFKTLAATPKHIETIAHIVEQIIHNGQFSDKAFEHAFKTDKSIRDADKAFIVRNVYRMIQNWRLLNEIAGRLAPQQPANPVWLLGIDWILSGQTLPPWPIFKPINSNKALEIYKSLQNNRAIALSVPNWLDEAGMKELGERWPSILQALNGDPSQAIRANTLKIKHGELFKILRTKGITIQNHHQAVDAILIKDKTNIFRLPEFQQGLFEMQDISSQLTGHFTNPQAGMRVIDGCAGNGGKTLHLASLMQNKGRIIALDIYPAKLDNLKKRARKAGASIIETRLIDSSKVIKRLHGSADLVLLDVPCSGLGVLKRNPEIKWNLQPADLENLKKTQADILNRYCFMVKPGGSLVYATCSILPSENSHQIRQFLELHGQQFEFAQEQTILPEEGYDGFYMAMLKRKP